MFTARYELVIYILFRFILILPVLYQPQLSRSVRPRLCVDGHTSHFRSKILFFVNLYLKALDKSRREVFINIIKKVLLISIRTMIVDITFAIWHRLICGLLYLCQVTHIALLATSGNTHWYSHTKTDCHSSFLKLSQPTMSPFSAILFGQNSAKNRKRPPRPTTVSDIYRLSHLQCPRWANPRSVKA